MKVRSTPLYTYLFETGALNGTPEEIDSAKREFRRLYKRNWKKRKRLTMEIRYTVTLKQFAVIKSKAQSFSMKHSTYAKQTLLKATGQPTAPATALLEVLQSVGMASIAIEHKAPLCRIQELVRTAELKLLKYLKI